MSVGIEDRIRVFVAEVEAAPEYDDYEELLGLFSWRQGLADEVPFAADIDGTLVASYLEAERRFQELLPALSRRFPEALESERERLAQRVAG